MLKCGRREPTGTGVRVGPVDVVPSRDEDRPALEAFLRRHHALRVARRGEVVDSLPQPAFLARSGDELVGVATYVVRNAECELLTLHADQQWRGVGSALVAAVQEAAAGAGCARLWLVTTNDNVDALRFYQRRGFFLAHLRPGAVDEARRTLKPEIPTVGDHGIDLRDELELELHLNGLNES
jgi:GNAT superfamily N-acetyltransferase